jgi:DNA-binding response OmpR family regulator
VDVPSSPFAATFLETGMRREDRMTYVDSVITVGSFDLDVLTHRLTADDRSIQLSPLASRFLEVLALSDGSIVDRNSLIQQLWRGDYLVGNGSH